MRSLVRSSVAVVAAGVLVLTPGAAGAAGVLVPAVPMTTAPAGLSPYRPQTTCDPVVKPGLRALRDMVLGYYGIGRDGGITRACNISARSEHQEGRAWDWMLDVNNPSQRAAGDDFTLWLTGPDSSGEAAG